jgi:actin-related protein
MPFCEIDADDDIWRYDIMGQEDLNLWRTKIWQVVKRVFRYELMISRVQECTVVILTDTLFPVPLKRLLTDVLFREFQVERVLFQPSVVCTVVGCGARNGLVIDLGWQHTTVTPIYELREIVATTATSCRCMEEFVTKGGYSVEEREQAVASYYLDENGRDDDEEQSIPSLIRRVLSRLSSEVRAAVCERIMIVGAGARVDGFQSRLVTRLREEQPQASAVGGYGAWKGAIVWLQEANWYRRGTRIQGEIVRDKYLDGTVYIDDMKIAV